MYYINIEPNYITWIHFQIMVRIIIFRIMLLIVYIDTKLIVLFCQKCIGEVDDAIQSYVEALFGELVSLVFPTYARACPSLT